MTSNEWASMYPFRLGSNIRNMVSISLMCRVDRPYFDSELLESSGVRGNGDSMGRWRGRDGVLCGVVIVCLVFGFG